MPLYPLRARLRREPEHPHTKGYMERRPCPQEYRLRELSQVSPPRACEESQQPAALSGVICHPVPCSG
jgi:hypothetical protein